MATGPMNRTDRLLGVLLELQSRRAARAEDLAEHFETSKRTIYRDIQALAPSRATVYLRAAVGTQSSHAVRVWKLTL